MKRALVVIDVQNEYVTGRLPVAYPDVGASLRAIGEAMEAARAAGIPIVVTQDTGPAADPIFAEGSDGWQLHEVVADRSYDHLVRRSLPGAFTDTDLDRWLRRQEVDTVSLVGYMIHNCIDTTARQAVHAGFRVEVLADATGTLGLWHDRGRVSGRHLYEATLTVLHSRFAGVTTTREWIKALADGIELSPVGCLQAAT